MGIEAREIFAENLRMYAGRCGLTQADIAAHMGCSSSTASDWFSGKKYPRPDKVQRLAALLGVSLSDFTTPRDVEEARPAEADALLRDELIAMYGEARPYLDENDIEDLKTFIRMKAEIKKRKEQNGETS